MNWMIEWLPWSNDRRVRMIAVIKMVWMVSLSSLSDQRRYLLRLWCLWWNNLCDLNGLSGGKVRWLWCSCVQFGRGAVSLVQVIMIINDQMFVCSGGGKSCFWKILGAYFLLDMKPQPTWGLRPSWAESRSTTRSSPPELLPSKHSVGTVSERCNNWSSCN